MKRRTMILLGAGAAGASVITGWSLLPPRSRLHGAKPLAVSEGEIALNGWIKLAPDNTVTLMMPKSEMGQGAHTGLAMLVAEELDCGLANIRIESSPIDKIYGNVTALAEGIPFRPEDEGIVARTARWFTTKITRELGLMMTGGSSSIRDLWIPLREASAMVRATLVESAAKHWGVAATTVTIAEGRIADGAGHAMAFGEAVTKLGGALQAPKAWKLKDPAQFRIIGNSIPRLESAAKTTATAGFGIDVMRPGMLYASVKMCPVVGGEVKSMDTAQAAAMPGVKKVVPFSPAPGGSGGVAVIADTYWHAAKAVKSIQPEWDKGMGRFLDTSEIYKQLGEAAHRKGGFAYWKTGDMSAMTSNTRILSAEYRAPYLAHAAMEPVNCTIEVKDSSAEVWIPTQVPSFVRMGVARELGLAEEAVTVHVTYLGGGFGRRLENDIAVQAAKIAKQMRGVPIQILWTREQDMRHDFYRPACVSVFEGALDANTNNLVAWRNHSAGPAVVAGYLPRNAGMPGAGPDKTSSEGAFDQPYEFPNAFIAHETVDLQVPTGFYRAVGHSHHAFFQESFLDELAEDAKVDPLEFRERLLKRHPRHVAVLRLAAEKAGWGTPLAKGRGRGIALHESFNSIVAQVAEVSVESNEIKVHRVVCAIDCGLPVNPGLIAQQMESSVIFGMSMALYGNITIRDGEVKESNFHDYKMVRMKETPVIEVHVAPSTRPPEGVGEPGVPPVAPAIANAVFQLTGKRLRSMPFHLNEANG